MIFLNPIPNLFWFLLLIPIAIFIINNRRYKKVKFSSVFLLTSLKSKQINKIKFLNILLIIIRTLIIILILLIIMKPHKKGFSSIESLNQDKIMNLIFIDDSFSNIYGTINGIDQLVLINDIIDGICKSYPIDSKLKIFSLNKELIFDGFNDNNFDKNILSFDYNDANISKILDSNDKEYHKNIHIITRFNDNSIQKINQTHNEITSIVDDAIFFIHTLPDLRNNQFIKEIKLIDGLNQKFSSYEINVFNDSNQEIDLAVSVNKNLYDYDSILYIDNTLPVYRSIITIPAKDFILDTMRINLDLNEPFELLFNLEPVSSDFNNTEWVDDRIEDNYYSYSLNLPDNIDISVFYNDINSKVSASSILESFKVNTYNIDSSFYKIEYFLTEGLQKYSNINNESNILLFLGYNLFESSDNKIISDFLDRENSQILIFPTEVDINKEKYLFKIDSSTLLENFYKEKPLNSYDTISFSQNLKLDNAIIKSNNFKIYNYFYHKDNKGSILNIDESQSIWSRYLVGNGFIDLFGFFLNYGNNFFNDEFRYSIPLMYKILIGDRLNLDLFNLKMSQAFKISNYENQKIKFINLKNDSTIFLNSDNLLIHRKGLMALINNEKIDALYSFNPQVENFTIKAEFGFPCTIIDYKDNKNNKDFFSNELQTSDLSKYFIYLLFLLLAIELILSNAKPPKSI